MTLVSSLTMQHGSFTLPITQSLTSPGTAVFGHGMIFDMLFVANWNKIRDYRQRQTNLNTAQIHSMQVDYDYEVGDKVLVKQDGILHKAESPYSKMSWTITTIWNN